jgi:protein-S-isoprenylcysteine O-methyltransferase Ste14
VIREAVAAGADIVTVNPTGIIGPYDFRPSRMGEVLLDLYHRRLPGLVAGGFDWVDVRDVAASTLAAVGAVFNLVNGYLNARWLTVFGRYDAAWLGDPRFVIGAVVMIAGFAINLRADALRAPGETAYKIPDGALYRYVSCPNYLGEIVEWFGWALLTWSLAGLSFAVWTAANLAPRALAHHRWYRERFTDYPAGRRALIPFVL